MFSDQQFYQFVSKSLDDIFGEIHVKTPLFLDREKIGVMDFAPPLATPMLLLKTRFQQNKTAAITRQKTIVK